MIMTRTLFKAAVAVGLAFGLGTNAYAAQPVSLDELLEQVRQGRVKDAAENQQRIQEFQRDRSRQQQLVQQMQAEQTRQEQLSAQLENTFELNDAEIIDLVVDLLGSCPSGECCGRPRRGCCGVQPGVPHHWERLRRAGAQPARMDEGQRNYQSRRPVGD